jgi:hypothetical protein
MGGDKCVRSRVSYCCTRTCHPSEHAALPQRVWAMKTGLAVSMSSIIARVMSGVCGCAEGRARVALTRMLVADGVGETARTPLGIRLAHLWE